MKERLDLLLVEQHLAESREKAKRYIQTGAVRVNGLVVEKAGTFIDTEAKLEIIRVEAYVSRGGYKLEKALQCFSINLFEKNCIDIGASTGGFTDCMLQNGAKRVIAIDVGTNQLVDCLRMDDRVISMENTNIRYVKPEDMSYPADFISIDISFISLTKVLDAVSRLLKEGAELVCLVKPQFEAGREHIGKKGVVKDPAIHKFVLDQVISCARSYGFILCGLDFSPIKGPEGNIEYLLYAKKEYPTQNDVSKSCDLQIQRIVTLAHQMLDN